MAPSKCMHKRTFTLLLFLLPFALILPSRQLFAAELVSDSVQNESGQANNSAGISAVLDVLSSEPSTGNLTTIEASGMWRNGCVPELDSVVLDMGYGTGIVLITAMAEQADYTCGQAETAWSFPIDIEFDLPGYYIAELLIVSEQLETTELTASKEILVEGDMGFTPQIPQLDEQFTINVTGIHGDACVPEYVSHTIVDGTITVEIMSPENVCGQVLTPWAVDVDISALESGEYNIEVYKSYQYEGIPWDRTLYKTDTLSIGVRASQVADYFIYLPSIASD